MSAFDDGLAIGLVIGKKQGGGGGCVPINIGGKTFQVTFPSNDSRVADGTYPLMIPRPSETFILSFGATEQKWVNKPLSIIYAPGKHSISYSLVEDNLIEHIAPEGPLPVYSTLVENI